MINCRYGLLGEHLKHSFSPMIHNEIFKSIKQAECYELIEIEESELKSKMNEFKALGVKGLNVTIPYKVKIMKHLDFISKEAEKIGAVNTIEFANGALIGHNTDYHGFGMTIDRLSIDISGKSATILGTGGASKAVTQLLLDKGIGNIKYASRNVDNDKKREFEFISYSSLDSFYGDILINCTPCGMYPNIEDTPVGSNVVEKYACVIDLIYNPVETVLLKSANMLGLKTMNGFYMLVAQAYKAQTIWNRIPFDIQAVDHIYEKIRG